MMKGIIINSQTSAAMLSTFLEAAVPHLKVENISAGQKYYTLAVDNGVLRLNHGVKVGIEQWGTKLDSDFAKLPLLPLSMGQEMVEKVISNSKGGMFDVNSPDQLYEYYSVISENMMIVVDPKLAAGVCGGKFRIYRIPASIVDSEWAVVSVLRYEGATVGTQQYKTFGVECYDEEDLCCIDRWLAINCGARTIEEATGIKPIYEGDSLLSAYYALQLITDAGQYEPNDTEIEYHFGPGWDNAHQAKKLSLAIGMVPKMCGYTHNDDEGTGRAFMGMLYSEDGIVAQYIAGYHMPTEEQLNQLYNMHYQIVDLMVAGKLEKTMPDYTDKFESYIQYTGTNLSSCIAMLVDLTDDAVSAEDNVDIDERESNPGNAAIAQLERCGCSEVYCNFDIGNTEHITGAVCTPDDEDDEDEPEKFVRSACPFMYPCYGINCKAIEARDDEDEGD